MVSLVVQDQFSPHTHIVTFIMPVSSPIKVLLLVVVVGVCVVSGDHHEDFGKISMRCVSEGRFSHPEDCGSFVDCLYSSRSADGDDDNDDDEPQLIARVGSCRGRAFHPTLKKCIDLNAMRGCLPRAARALVADPKLDFVCEGSNSEFVCADCKTLVNCVNGTAYPEVCVAGDLCATKEAQFGGGVCYPGQPPECHCDQPNQFKIDLYDETRFFFCEDVASDPIIYQCPEDHAFDPNTSQCRNFDGLPECTSIGVFANAENCSQYYNCIFTTNGWVQKAFSCNNDTHQNLMYNEISGRCEDPCEWDTGSFSCNQEGRFNDPTNCNAYFECVSDTNAKSGFRQTHHTCPEDYEWDPSARNDYGHCVLKGTSKASCIPVVASKCSVNRDQCNK
ncbi:hypothetical protein Pcinc_036245 [Petrolisthes cinctipes]|uniref:Chitin-binding type-2 domain-containing protein n=1 Tax=Petrolisthes cinctipes TaxID=88211 RepID=A0AAE1BV42_PETCI|nr:hypothetical protein Pcinc_036245 [Petrolisthes cinctipes]